MKKFNIFLAFTFSLMAFNAISQGIVTIAQPDITLLPARIIDAPKGVLNLNYQTQVTSTEEIYFTTTIGSDNTLGNDIRGGVYGEAGGPAFDANSSSIGLGVYGLAYGIGSGAQVGVAGAANGVGSGDQFGLLGYSRGHGAGINYGTYGLADGNAGAQYGAYGMAAGSGEGLKIGAYGLSKSESGVHIGVGGEANGTSDQTQFGLFGYSHGNGINYGCYGLAIGAGSDQFAVYGTAANINGATGNIYGVFGELPAGIDPAYQAATTGLINDVDGGNFRAGIAGATLTTGNNYWAGYFIGDIGFTGQITNVSDARLKKNVKKVDNALDKIMALEPVHYQFRTEEYSDINLAKGLHYGFIAQDLERVLPALVNEKKYAGIDTEQGDKNYTTIKEEAISDASKTAQSNSFNTSHELKSVNYIGLIPLLTKGMQEQEAVITEQQNTINELQNEVDDLTAQLTEIRAMLQNLQTGTTSSSAQLPPTSGKAFLEQNAPNPFNQQTTIRHFIPQGTQQAQLQITDLAGRVLHQIAINQSGWGVSILESGELPMGTYMYALVIDGKVEVTKQMVVVR